MTAREYLERPLKYEKRIRRMMDDLNELKSSVTNCTPTYGGDTVKHTRSVDGVYVMVMKIRQAEARLDEEIDRLVDAKREIEKMINTIDSEAVRQALRLVYLEYRTKTNAAEELDVTRQTVINRCNAGLAMIERRLLETNSNTYCI